MATYIFDRKNNTVITDAIEYRPGIWVHEDGRHICTDAHIGDDTSGRNFCFLDEDSAKEKLKSRELERQKEEELERIERVRKQKEDAERELERQRKQKEDALHAAQKKFREESIIPQVSNNYSAVDALPEWVSEYISNNGSVGRLNNGDNSGQDETEDPDKIKKYLGTYFPRTYSEALCIYLNIFNFEKYAQLIVDKETIRILDIGCGNGGQTIALCSILINKLQNLRQIEIISYDAEEGFKKDYSNLIEKLSGLSGITISLDFRKKLFVPQDNGENTLSFQSLSTCFQQNNERFDFIHSFKMLCELVGPSSRSSFINTDVRTQNIRESVFEACSNVYRSFIASLLPLLGENGLFVISDISRKRSRDLETDEEEHYWYANFLSQGTLDALSNLQSFKILLPAICSLKQWDRYCHNCFSQRQYSFPNEYIYQEGMDNTEKISFRVISQQTTVSDILKNYDTQNSFIKNKRQAPDPDILCHNSQSGSPKDAFVL